MRAHRLFLALAVTIALSGCGNSQIESHSGTVEGTLVFDEQKLCLYLKAEPEDLLVSLTYNEERPLYGNGSPQREILGPGDQVLFRPGDHVVITGKIVHVIGGDYTGCRYWYIEPGAIDLADPS